ncbi:MAG TPA: helix-turn-helix domain-containing protein [Streptosporangiaceae bacterium]|jgi:excisionase family DNA binding protein
MTGSAPDEVYLTVDEVARQLKISRWKVYELIRTRELASFHVGRCRRVPASAVVDMVDRLMTDAA